MKKLHSKKKTKNKTHKKEEANYITGIRYTIKAILILTILAIVFMQTTQKEFSNTTPLLSVNENEEGEIRGANIINLDLKITRGNGQVFVNSNSLKEIDTQLSITNGKNIACELLDLNCDNVDFHYTFNQDSVILKGPSATSSIALITAKTLNEEKMPENIAMTGSLNSVGVVGPVGGIEEKIKLAQQKGFEKVIIPLTGTPQNTTNFSIDIVPVLDLTQAYNAFDGKQIQPTTEELDTSSYDKLMSSLVDDMCNITNNLEDSLITTNYSNTSNENIYDQAQDNINSSKKAKQRNNYYSAASFCFGANNNLEALNQYQQNNTQKEITKKINALNENITDKKDQIDSNQFRQINIKTRNDFYVYLILQDRINEAQNYLEPHTENASNTSIRDKQSSFAFAKQRFESVKLWERFIAHQGEEIQFTDEIIDNTCRSVTREIESKSQVLEQYEIGVFNDLIDEQKEYRNQNSYLCLYNGLELSGRIDTAFFSFNIEQQQDVTNRLFNLTESKIAKQGDENFPLMPFMYLQYSKELFTQGDFRSSLLYLNYAQSFSNVDFYLQQPQTTGEKFVEETQNEIITNPFFVLGLLLILGFV